MTNPTHRCQQIITDATGQVVYSCDLHWLHRGRDHHDPNGAYWTPDFKNGTIIIRGAA